MGWKSILLAMVVSAGVGIVIGARLPVSQNEAGATKSGTEANEIIKETEKKLPNGETITERVIERHSTSTTVIRPPAARNRVLVGVGTGVDLVPVYKLGYERRVLDKVWLGVYGTTDKTVGLSLGVEF